MKILHVIPSVGPRRGGPSFTMQAMARALVGCGLDVHIATTNDDGPDRLNVCLNQSVQQDAVTYWYFPRQTRFYTASWPLTVWLSRHVRDYDLVHIHALFSYASLPAAFFAMRQAIPYIVRPLGTLKRYGMQQRRPWLKRLSFVLIERHIIRHAAVIHFSSEQERLESMKFAIPQATVVIPNPVECNPLEQISNSGQLREHYPQLDGKIVILFLGRLDPVKGLDILLPAFAAARHRLPQVALVIAGSGDPAFVKDLRVLAEKLGIAMDIVWTGFLNDSDKRMTLAGADMFVLPSYSENFGNVVVEAMAHGLPVIVSDQVGIQQEIARHQAGLVTPCTHDDLAWALLQLADNYEARQWMGANGRQLSLTRFSPAVTTAKLVKLYTELLPSHLQEITV